MNLPRKENVHFLYYAIKRVWMAAGASEEHAHYVADAISFAHRGGKRAIQTPFEELSETCVGCKACAFVCPTGVIEIDEAD